MGSRGHVQLAVAAALVIGVAGACTKRENRAANNSAGERTDTTARSDTRDTGPTGAGATQQTWGQGAGSQMTVAQVASNPSQYVGQRVTVRADLGSSVGQNAFTLADASTASTGATKTDDRAGNQLLVLSPSGVPADRHDLTISGTLRLFTSAADLHRDAPWLGSSGPSADLDRFRNKPVIVADSIRTADGRELVSGTGGLPATSGEPGSGRAGRGSTVPGNSGTSGTPGPGSNSGTSGSGSGSGSGASGAGNSGGATSGGGSSGSGGSVGSLTLLTTRA